MDLKNIGEIKKLDSMKVAESLANYTDQIRETWEQSFGSDIPKLSPRNVVICGMGGSSNAGKIIKSLYKDTEKVSFILHNDYDLPSFVDKDSLVILNTYSGNTEETLSAYEPAKKAGATVLGITSGGKVGKMIESGEIKGVIVSPTKNPTGYPKTGLGVSLGALLGALAKTGVIKITQKELFEALTEVDKLKEGWLLKNSNDNYAFETAKILFGNIPVLFGGEPLTGSLQAGRNAIDEISRNFTLFFDFPEVNHILIEATQKPDVAKEKLIYLFFQSNLNHDRVKIRMEITQKIFDEQGVNYQKIKSEGSSKLVQALLIPNFCAWIGFYLAILGNDDPGPEPWIIKLKDKLGQPTH